MTGERFEPAETSGANTGEFVLRQFDVRVVRGTGELKFSERRRLGSDTARLPQTTFLSIREQIFVVLVVERFQESHECIDIGTG